MVYWLDKEKMKMARSLQGLTLAEVAKKISCTPSYMRIVESGPDRLKTVKSHVRIARKLAKVYGLDSHLDLMTDDGEPEDGEK